MHILSYPMGSMQFARGLISWDNDTPSLSLTCKRLRPLAPKLTPAPSNSSSSSAFDLKNFIRPDIETHVHTNKLASPPYSKQVEIAQGGGTRWNPTQEQIGILEMMYRGGMRTPNAQQIEQITLQLGKYGKIEGKNVFYWFQNHKARERQKQKRNSLGLAHSPTTSLTTITLQTRGDYKVEISDEESGMKRNKRTFEWLEEERRRSCSCRDEGEYRTLMLFPLHPELADHK